MVDRRNMSFINTNYEKNTFPYRLESIVKTIPDKPAIVQGNRMFTWKELDDRVNRLANAFLDLGIKKGERIAIALYNSPEWMECYFAADKIGAIPTNLCPRYVPDEIKYILDDSDAVISVIPEDMVESLVKVRSELNKLLNCIVVGKNVPEDMYGYEALISGYPTTQPEIDFKIKNDVICYIMYTGGTTGFPKGTVWEHECRLLGLSREFLGIVSSEESVAGLLDGLQLPKEAYQTLGKLLPGPVGRALGFASPSINWIIRRPSTPRFATGLIHFIQRFIGGPMTFRLISQLNLKLLVTCPLYHGAAYELSFAVFPIGTTLVFLENKSFTPEELWKTVEKEKISLMIIVGDAFARPMVEELERAEKEGISYDFSSLISIISSGVMWTPEVKKRLLKYLPHCILTDAVGTTEVSEATPMVSTSSSKEIEKVAIKINPKDKRHPRRIINPETGMDAKPGEIGELIYGGYMAKEYWKDPKKTARTFKTIDDKRWFFVGDMGTVDENGYFHLIGRGTSVVNTGGEKVYPEEVEEIIKLNSKVEDAAVIGLPDDRWGEAVTAIIQLRDGEVAIPDEIIDYCRGKMAGYKKPKNVIFTDSLPRTMSGKVEKTKLMEMAIDLIEGR